MTNLIPLDNLMADSARAPGDLIPLDQLTGGALASADHGPAPVREWTPQERAEMDARAMLPRANAASAYAHAHPGMDPMAIQGAFGLLPHFQTPQEAQREQLAAGAQDQGLIHSAISQGLHDTGLTAIGGGINQHLSDAERALGFTDAADRQAAYGNQAFGVEGSAAHPVANFVGGLGGQIAEQALPGRMGQILQGWGTAEQAAHDIDVRRQEGQYIGTGAALANIAGKTAANVAQNEIYRNTVGKQGQALGSPVERAVVQKFAPFIQKLVGSPAVSRVIAAGVTDASAGALDQLLNNEIDRATGVNPSVSLGAGVWQAMLMRGALGGAGRAAHEAPNMLADMRAKQSAARGAPAQTPVSNPGNQADNEVRQHTPENRLPGAGTEPGPKTQPDNQTPAVEAGQPAGGETAGERRVLESYNRHLDASGPVARPNLGEQRVFDAMDRAADRPSNPDENPMKLRPGQRLRDMEPAAPASDHVEGHPQRLNDVDALTDWYAKQNPNDSTGDLIKTMAPHTPYVQAEVPVDHVKPLSDGNDIDRGKVDALKNMTPEQRRALGPAILGPDGEVFDGNHRAVAAQEAGDTHLKAFVPEYAVGKNGIKALEAPAAETPKAQTPIQQLLAKGREATGELADVRRRGNARPGFVRIPDSKFVEQDIAPRFKGLATDTKKSLDAVNNFFGTGLNLKGASKDAAIGLREMDANREVDRARIETAVKPYRDVMAGMSKAARIAWVDHFEQTGESLTPELKGYAKWRREFNDNNIREAAKYGLNTGADNPTGTFNEHDEFEPVENPKGWSTSWFGRAASAEETTRTGARSSLTGPEGYRKGRTFERYSDLVNWAKKEGVTLPYDNEVDMGMYKDFQVRRGIESRKMLYGAEDKGQSKWVPAGARAPEGFDTKLNDPLAKQTRDVIAPKWMVAKLLNLPHAEAREYLESPQWQANSKILRPGDAIPAGYAKSGNRIAGQYMADSNTAGVFNNLISAGLQKDVPVLSRVAALRRAVTRATFALPAAHTALGTIGNAVEQLSNAIEAVRYGQWGNALDAAHKAVNPISSARFGSQLRGQAANPQTHPELEGVVQTSIKGGNKFDLKSVLNKSAFDKASEAWASGNKIGAGLRFADGVYHTVEAPVFEHYIPDLKASAKGMAAKIAMDRNLTGKALSEHMARAQDDVDNILGMVKRSHQFQNKVVSDAQDLLFDAPKFAEGTFRFAGAFGRDTIRGLADIAQGKAPTITRAHYTAMAGLMTQMIGAAVTQMVWTKLHTGKMIAPTTLEDYFKPRTGDTDEKGREERVSILSPFSALFGAVEHGAGSVTGRIAHLWKTGAAEITGHDDRGRSIEGERMKFLAKSLTPLPVQSLLGLNDDGRTSPLRERLAGAVGMHFSHDYASSAANAAQQAIYDRRGNGEFSRAETDKMDVEGRLRQELHEQNSSAERDIQQAIEGGKITRGDARSIRKVRPEGLPGLLKSSALDARDMMEKVWPKMTPQERRDNQWAIRGKVGRSDLSGADKRKYWDRIKADTANVK